MTGQQLAVLKQHEDAVAKLIVPRERMLLLSTCESSADHQVCVWSLVDFSLVASFTPDECPREVRISDTGSFISYRTASHSVVTLTLTSSSSPSPPKLMKSDSVYSYVVRKSLKVSFSARKHRDPHDIDTDSDIEDVYIVVNY